MSSIPTQPKQRFASRYTYLQHNFRMISSKLTLFGMRDQDLMAGGHNTSFETSFLSIDEDSDYIHIVSKYQSLREKRKIKDLNHFGR